jgi:hypothetical protein
MAAIAPQARVAAPAAPAVARPRPRAASERRPKVASGVVWIVIIGALLVGVVFMNVAVLRLNIKLDQAGRDRARLRADVAQQSSELSSAQAAARIQAQARGLGLVPANPAETVFLDLPH